MPQSLHRILQGTVVSDKMEKTIVVRIDRTKVHPRYHKRYTVSKRFKVHDPKNEYHVGQVVQISETRPMSKDKRWQVVKRV